MKISTESKRRTRARQATRDSRTINIIDPHTYAMGNWQYDLRLIRIPSLICWLIGRPCVQARMRARYESSSLKIAYLLGIHCNCREFQSGASPPLNNLVKYHAILLEVKDSSVVAFVYGKAELQINQNYPDTTFSRTHSPKAITIFFVFHAASSDKLKLDWRMQFANWQSAIGNCKKSAKPKLKPKRIKRILLDRKTMQCDAVRQVESVAVKSSGVVFWFRCVMR